MWGDHCLQVGRGCPFSCLVGKHQGLESDASCYREPVQGAKERGDMRKFGEVEHQAGSSILDELERSDGGGGEPGQECVAVIKAGDDQ